MTKAHIAFRVDASETIGTGHVMRCLTLANELQLGGAKTRFICRAHHGHLAERIISERHEIVLLPVVPETARCLSDKHQPEYAAWLGADWMTDATETVRSLVDFAPSWLVVDHYAIGASWEQHIRTHAATRIMVIDGMANRVHDCNLLLDQTFSPTGAARWDDLLPASCQRLIGPQFALLRPEFVSAHRLLRQRNGNVQRIFVAFGGIDEPNATAVALEALAGLGRPDLAVDVVVGAGNPHREQLQDRHRGRSNITIHIQPPNVAELMANADLAISAGGTLLLEQCFMQLPAVVVSIAANQIRPSQALHDRGAVLFLGNLDTNKPGITAESIRQNLMQLLAEPQRLLDMQAVARELMARPKESISQLLLN